jgi:hypothetical protein
MKVYVLVYEFATWTEQGGEILGIYSTKASAYDSMVAEAKSRNWKDLGDERAYKATESYIFLRIDWELTRTLRIEEYDVKN